MNNTLANFTDVLVDEICNSQPLSLSSSVESRPSGNNNPFGEDARIRERPPKGTGQRGQFRCTEEIDLKYRDVFSYPYFNLVQSSVIEDALYSDKSIVVCAPTGSGKTVVFEMAIVQLLMELEEKQYTDDFKIIYMAPVKALCTERLTEWYPKFTRLGLLCIEVTGDTDVDFTQLKPYKIIITTPEKWDMLTRRWRDHRGLVEVIKLFLIDEVHILNDETRGPVLEAVVSRMKTIENSAQSVHRIEQLQKEIQGQKVSNKSAPRIRFVAVSATVSNPEDVANWLGTSAKPAVFYKFGDECRPVKLKRIVEGYPCAEGTSIFKFDIILNYKLWPVIQKYQSGKPTLIFCNTRKSVALTAETLSKELTISFNAEQKAKLTALASSIKNKKLQALVMSGVGCHHAGLLYEERQSIECAFRNRDLPILITTTTLAMGVNLPAHLVIVKNTQQYVNGAYQEYSISTVLQMVGRAGRPQFDTEATAVIMTRLVDKVNCNCKAPCKRATDHSHQWLSRATSFVTAQTKVVGDWSVVVYSSGPNLVHGKIKPRYQTLLGGCEPLQSYLHKRLAENLNSEAALKTVGDVAQCVQWLCSTFLYVRAARDPKKYLGLPQNSPQNLISKKIEELCVKAMNGLASSGLITMDDASCIESTEAGRLMSIFYLDLETMKQIMKIEGTESLERLLVLICESHELADMHLRVDERRCLNLLNRNNAAATIRFPMKGKISTRQMKLNCVIQAVLGCLSIPDPSLNQEAMKIMRIADRVCKCLVTYVTRPDLISQQPQFYSAVLNSILLAKCVAAHLWENSPFVSKQLKGIGPTFSTLLASAGKVKFMLLEESHPRDLERIMNKGPPAGNVLRKQVSLLPKYQLTMIPVDEKTVTVQLVLLNQSHLAENMENLTAGDSHKSYIIVGDSNNNLLLLAPFKDRDLISVFDGTITYEVKRKHNFEHKIFAHCVSSSFVGIDVQSEYLFNDLEPFLRGTAPCIQTLTNATPMKKTAERQTYITDKFKERKRKINPDAIEKSKEKRKRENAIIENFKYLKQSFETASKNVNQIMNRQNRQKEESLNKNSDARSLSSNTMSNSPYAVNTNPANEKLNPLTDQNTCFEEIYSDDFLDDEKIDGILNEIENEMGKSKAGLDKAKPINSNQYFRERNLNVPNPFSTKLTADGLQNSTTRTSSNKTLSAPRKPKTKTPKSNYTFIELLERQLSLSDDEEKAEVPQKDNGFSDTIKSQIQRYLTKTQTKTAIPDTNIKMLLDKTEDGVPSDDEKTQEVKTINQDTEILNSPMQSPYPRYVIKEILGGKNVTQQHIKTLPTVAEENLICNQESRVYDNMTNIINIKNDDTSHYDTKIGANTTITTHDTYTIKIDEGDRKYNSENEVKGEDLDETLIVNCDDNSEMFTNLEQVKREVDKFNENALDDIICVEEYDFKKANNEYRNNLASLDLDVIMISPTEVSDNFSNTNDIDRNDQRSDMNEQNLITQSMVTKGSDNNQSCVVLDDKHFQNLYECTKTDTLATNTCLDIVVKSRHQPFKNDIASNNEVLAMKDIGYNIFEPIKETALANIPCSGVVLRDRYQHFKYNKPSNDQTLAIEDIGHNLNQSNKADTLPKCLRSDIVLKDRHQVVTYTRIPHDKTMAIEDIGCDINSSSNADAIAKLTCSDVVLKSRKQVVGNSISSHNKPLAIEDNGLNPVEPNKVALAEYPSSDKVLKYKNQLIGNNREMPDKTLAIEHVDPAQSNKSVCYPFVPSDLNASYDSMKNFQNNARNSSKNVDVKKQKTEYVKRYTYSTSKIDVCTKQTPEYCVQVIKEVKMDLDITAIVSRKHNSSRNYKADCEETSANIKRMKMIELEQEDIPFQNTTEGENKITTTANYKIKNTSNLTIPSTSLSRPELARIKNAFKPPYKAKDEEESKNNKIQNIHESKEHSTRYATVNKNQTNQYDEIQISEIRPKELETNENKNNNFEDTCGIQKESESGTNLATGDNKIRNLLQKYSKIYAKNAVKPVTPTCSGINRTAASNSSNTIKSQKPFKITDIHKLHATLPETIVDNKPEVENSILQFPKVNRYVEAKNKRADVNSRQYTQYAEMKPTEEMPEYESITNLDLEPISSIHLPDNVDLEPSKDYKIDQSMFDPKTLLQSVAGDESDEIVPPPPEFCDGITYSPGFNNAEASMAGYSVTERAPQLNIFTEKDIQYNESIFDDCSASNLTLPTEIETWNLSQEEEPRNAMSLSPAQLFTVMRKNTNNDYNFMQHSLMSRKGKLGKFKFDQKDKLKIRK